MSDDQAKLGAAVAADDLESFKDRVDHLADLDLEVFARAAFSLGATRIARYCVESLGVPDKLRYTSGRLLTSAALGGQAALVAFLIDEKHTLDLIHRLPLVKAAAGGNLACVRCLVEAGAPINQGHPGFENPLMAALRTGHTEIADYLREHGAEVGVFDEPPGDGG